MSDDLKPIRTKAAHGAAIGEVEPQRGARHAPAPAVEEMCRQHRSTPAKQCAFLSAEPRHVLYDDILSMKLA